MRSRNKTEWLKAMDDEIKSLYDNNTWELIEKPAEARLVSYKWIFKVKEGVHYKKGVNFNDVLSHVVKHISIRILLAMVANFDVELEHMDVNITLLYSV